MATRLFMLLTILVSTIGYFATDIYLPSMPAMTDYFHTTNTYIQLTIPAYMLPYGLSPLYFGPLSDRFGRKPVILLGLVASMVATVLIIFATNIGLVILGRFLQGFTFGAVNVASRTMMTDKFRGPALAKFNSTITLFVPLVMSLAPPIGGIIEEALNWRYVFAALLGYQIIVALLIFIFLEETGNPSKQQKHDYAAVYGQLIRNTPFMLYGSLTVIAMMGITVYITLSAYLFQNFLHMTPTQYGCLSFIAGGCVLASAMTNIQLLKRLQPHQILHINWVIMLISAMALAYAHMIHSHSIPLIAFGALFYFFSLNMSFANAIANAFMQIDENYGSGTAVITAAQMIFAMLVSTLVSVLPENDVQPLMYAYFIMTFLYIPILVIANAKNTKISL